MFNPNDWAEREIELACKYERQHSGNSKDEWDYGCACYESALQAYKVLCEFGHSGMSMSITRQILDRLLSFRPLTPIEDIPEVWNDVSEIGDDGFAGRKYQCSRMSSLFKYVAPDGAVTYSDVDRFLCVDSNYPGSDYHNGLINRVLNETLPITMPYFPTGITKVYCELFLADPWNGAFDTIGILSAVKPDKTVTYINRFFKEDGDKWKEITQSEYFKRMELSKC